MWIAPKPVIQHGQRYDDFRTANPSPYRSCRKTITVKMPDSSRQNRYEGFSFEDLEDGNGGISLLWKGKAIAEVISPVADEIRAALSDPGAMRLSHSTRLAPSTATHITRPEPKTQQRRVVSVPTQGPVLLVANAGTLDQLTIATFGPNKFIVDNVSNRTGSKTWGEFPRYGKTIAGCKRAAARIMCEKLVWSQPGASL